LNISQTSAVVRDKHSPERVQQEAIQRDEDLVTEALGGGAAEDLKTVYRLMLGLSSHDLSAMRELLGMPRKVLFAAQRAKGHYLAAAFDYGSYVCVTENLKPKSGPSDFILDLQLFNEMTRLMR
jgi:hypothetical protein